MCWPCIPLFSRLPEDGTHMPKHVGVDTCHDLYFMIYFIVFYCVPLLLNVLNEACELKQTERREQLGFYLSKHLRTFHSVRVKRPERESGYSSPSSPFSCTPS